MSETHTERVKRLHSECKHKISVHTIRSRIYRGWSDEKIINTDLILTPRPKRSHPFKDSSFNRVARRKGWVK